MKNGPSGGLGVMESLWRWWEGDIGPIGRMGPIRWVLLGRGRYFADHGAVRVAEDEDGELFHGW